MTGSPWQITTDATVQVPGACCFLFGMTDQNRPDKTPLLVLGWLSPADALLALADASAAL